MRTYEMPDGNSFNSMREIAEFYDISYGSIKAYTVDTIECICAKICRVRNVNREHVEYLELKSLLLLSLQHSAVPDLLRNVYIIPETRCNLSIKEKLGLKQLQMGYIDIKKKSVDGLINLYETGLRYIEEHKR